MQVNIAVVLSVIQVFQHPKRGNIFVSSIELLDRKLCEKLVQSASLTIGHDVLITDESGIVIASNDPLRVGSLHEASLESICHARKFYHDSNAANKLAGTKPGMTIPLIVDAKVIGTIGITGTPHEISQYALLIQQLAQIFLDFERRQRSTTRSDYQKKNLLREIITYDVLTRGKDVVSENAYEFGVDLNTTRVAIQAEVCTPKSVSSDEKQLRLQQERVLAILSRHFDHPQDFVCPRSSTDFVVFAFLLKSLGKTHNLEAIKQKCSTIASECLAEDIRIRIGIGSLASSLESLRRSYENACFAARCIQAGVRSVSCLYVGDVVLEKLASCLPEDISHEVASRLFDRIQTAKNRDEILLTIEHWFRQRFNFVQTAQALHIHKSTLVYRFRRIQETCGLDLYDLDKVLALYLLDMRHRLEGAAPRHDT